MQPADARSRKKAVLLLGLLLVAAAVVLIVVSLQEGRAPERALDDPDATQTSADPGGPYEIRGTQVTHSPEPSGERVSGAARCVLEIAGTMSCPSGFAIAGNAEGLYPGKTVQLPLTIENPYEEELLVTAIDVAVTGTSASSCATSNLQASDYTGPGFAVQAKDSTSIVLSLTMSRAAPDACQSVTFTLAFTGEAEQA